MSEHPIVAFVRSKVSDPGRPFILIADLEAHPGRGDDVAAAIVASGAAGLTRADAGCIAYDLCRDADSPDRFLAYESWRDLSALEEHLTTGHFAALGAALDGLLAGAPTVRLLTPI